MILWIPYIGLERDSGCFDKLLVEEYNIPMSYIKKERNERLIKLRLSDPKKWTYKRLAQEFNISRPTAYMVIKRFVVDK